MISNTVTRKADVISAVAVLTDEQILETIDLGVHGNLNVYVYVSVANTITQVELDMDKYQAFGVADEVLDALRNCEADFDPSTLTKSELTWLIARMRARA